MKLIENYFFISPVIITGYSQFSQPPFEISPTIVYPSQKLSVYDFTLVFPLVKNPK